MGQVKREDSTCQTTGFSIKSNKKYGSSILLSSEINGIEWLLATDDVNLCIIHTAVEQSNHRSVALVDENLDVDVVVE